MKARMKAPKCLQQTGDKERCENIKIVLCGSKARRSRKTFDDSGWKEAYGIVVVLIETSSGICVKGTERMK